MLNVAAAYEHGLLPFGTLAKHRAEKDADAKQRSGATRAGSGQGVDKLLQRQASAAAATGLQDKGKKRALEEIVMADTEEEKEDDEDEEEEEGEEGRFADASAAGPSAGSSTCPKRALVRSRQTVVESSAQQTPPPKKRTRRASTPLEFAPEYFAGINSPSDEV